VDGILVKSPDFRFKPASVGVFVAAAAAAWVVHIFGQVVFPSPALVPCFARWAITLFALTSLVLVTRRLLRQNNLPTAILGVTKAGGPLRKFLYGILIGSLTMGIMMAILYAFVPFHFVSGPFGGGDIVKESVSYLLGNSLEEYMFRGFLLVILCQLIGWHSAVWVMALLFGFFHLPGFGLNKAGGMMVMTTAAFSFVMSFAFLATRSILCAIGVHVSANILLHAVVGLDGAGKSLFLPVFETPPPKNYDPGLIAYLVAVAAVSIALFWMIRLHRRFIFG
jgi:membrane protease YdiL (CAAX protease family)